MQQLLKDLKTWAEKYLHFDLICLFFIGYATAIILSEDNYIVRALTYFPLLLLLLTALITLLFTPQQIKVIYAKTLLFIITLTTVLLSVWIV
ncbi:MAG: hypothetical protein QNJ74_11130 [Trichodesmium sp. MO_231.B1]|nr:hypothetical protein [Trichodesmium sp. MO_231.B1]